MEAKDEGREEGSIRREGTRSTPQHVGRGQSRRARSHRSTEKSFQNDRKERGRNSNHGGGEGTQEYSEQERNFPGLDGKAKDQEDHRKCQEDRKQEERKSGEEITFLKQIYFQSIKLDSLFFKMLSIKYNQLINKLSLFQKKNKKKKNRQTDKQTNRQTDKQTNRQTDKQTNRQT